MIIKELSFDFEQVQPRDKNHLNQFIKELSVRLHPIGMEVLIAVPPKEGNQISSNTTMLMIIQLLVNI